MAHSNGTGAMFQTRHGILGQLFTGDHNFLSEMKYNTRRAAVYPCPMVEISSEAGNGYGWGLKLVGADENKQVGCVRYNFVQFSSAKRGLTVTHGVKRGRIQ